MRFGELSDGAGALVLQVLLNGSAERTVRFNGVWVIGFRQPLEALLV